MKLLRHLVILVMILLFLSGLGVLLYPYIHGVLADDSIRKSAHEFLTITVLPPDSSESETEPIEESRPACQAPTEPNEYVQLWRDMREYNLEIFQNGQQDLDCEKAYETPSFRLGDYGLESEIFAVISIPILELQMPIFLGASDLHMADGAALLSQTSIPIGGRNTNAVIAGHRGWRGASYFRYIDKLQPGDEVIITNLWDELHYEVCEIRIIQPYEIDEILIQPDRELITLLTCHPYASGGRQRYLVICERKAYESDPEIDHP